MSCPIVTSTKITPTPGDLTFDSILTCDYTPTYYVKSPAYACPHPTPGANIDKCLVLMIMVFEILYLPVTYPTARCSEFGL